MESGKKKSKNLKEKDKEIIINIILKYKNVIEDKKTDNISLKNKTETWRKITDKFNCESSSLRTTQQIKNVYKNAKCDLKKEISNHKMETYKTGGGTCSSFNENNPLLSVVSEQTTPIRNDYDSSHNLFEMDDVSESEVRILIIRTYIH